MEKLALLGGILLVGCDIGSEFEDDDDETAINISNYATGNDGQVEEIENHPDAPQILSAELWCDYVDC